MRPLLTTLAVFAALTAAAIAPGTRADAASPNWLARECGHHGITTSCTELPLDVDALLAARSLTFHDGAGKAVTASTGAAAWRIATGHSRKCVMHGDIHGCYLLASQTTKSLGRSLVLPDGMTISVTRFFH